MVLIQYLLAEYPNNDYVIAHCDHGIRDDSDQDAEFVRQYAADQRVMYEQANLRLGQQASEALARQKRYEFLRDVAKKHQAQAIITAHHQDDVLETLFINVIRGTGSRGLASLKNNNEILRPLLHVPKQDIYTYASKNAIKWREDPTNTDTKYLRNAIRHKIVATMPAQQRDKALNIVEQAQSINTQLDKELAAFTRKGMHKNQLVVKRSWFVRLPHTVASEVMYYIFKVNVVSDIDKKTVEQAVIAIKTMRPGKTLQLRGVDIYMTKRSARIKCVEKQMKTRYNW